MIKIEIREPIWKTRSIGVRADIIKEDLKIEILYKKADGQRLYPDIYTISKEKAKSYPIQYVGSNVKLHIIPIEDLEIIKMEKMTDDERDEYNYFLTQGLPIPNHLKDKQL